MTHPSNCERADGDTCVCQCGGSQHGWPGAISLIRRYPDALDEFRQRADRRWVAAEDHAAAGKNRSRSTINHKRAAVDTARHHVLRELRDELHATTNSVGEQEKPPHAPAEPPSSSAPHDATVDATTREREDNTNRKLATARTDVDRVEAVGELLGQVLAQVEREIGPLGVDTRTAMADHFWCELLVQLVVVIEEAKRAWDAFPQVVGKRLDKVVNASGRKIPTKVVTACTKQLWKRLTEALGLGGIEQAATLLPALRTLAVLLCKSPARHPAVVQHCLDPLKALLLDKAKQRLKQAFSENLLPEIRAQLG